MHLLNKKTLADAVTLPSFKTICEIHNELRENHKADCVPGYLLDLVAGKYGPGFLIPYVYIMRSVPPEFQRYFLTFLGRSQNLPSLFEELEIWAGVQNSDTHPTVGEGSAGGINVC